MSDWIILAVYVVGFVFTWRRSAYVLASDVSFDRHRITGDDLVLGLMVGFLIACFWPIVVPGYITWQIVGNSAFISEPKHIKRERELEQREERIRRLERELGIGNGTRELHR